MGWGVDSVSNWNIPTLAIRCCGRGADQRTRLTASGSARGYRMRGKQAFGFQTGEMVRASVPAGKKAGIHVGRVAIRATVFFNIQTPQRVVQGISHRYCKVIQRGDGYGYSLIAPSKEESRYRGDAPRRALSLLSLKAGVCRAN